MRGTLLVATLASSLGCASSYRPMVTPRVQVVQTSSGLSFVRSGKQYEAGFFGGGLAEAVSGVPEAVEHANTYSNLQLGGFVFVLGGAAAYGGAIASLGNARADADGNVDLTTATVFLGTGFALSLVGWIMFSSAPPHLWDAINIHNDEVQREAVRKWRERRTLPPATSRP
jgi:hypothetical protein